MPDSPASYDSTLATLQHSRRVDELLLQLQSAIQERLHKHDASKMVDPEKVYFDEYTPRLQTLVYGSDEYRECVDGLKPALDHHYASNRHHPEHFADGIDGMTLVDLVEMLCDWKAATERSDTGDLRRSLEHNQERFAMAPQLVSILRNTAAEFGWMSDERPRGVPLAHCQHREDDGYLSERLRGRHEPHVWLDITSANDDRWCDGRDLGRGVWEPQDLTRPCPCGYRRECSIHCGKGHETGLCPPWPEPSESHL